MVVRVDVLQQVVQDTQTNVFSHSTTDQELVLVQVVVAFDLLMNHLLVLPTHLVHQEMLPMMIMDTVMDALVGVQHNRSNVYCHLTA